MKITISNTCLGQYIEIDGEKADESDIRELFIELVKKDGQYESDNEPCEQCGHYFEEWEIEF